MANGKVFHRALYNYDSDAVSNETGLKCEDDSLAVQSQEAEANINTIVRNFGITGKVPESPVLPEYGDFTGVSDYRSAIEAIRKADADFLELPAEVRSRFDNDPQKLLEVVANRTPENTALLKELKLIQDAPLSEAGGAS